MRKIWHIVVIFIIIGWLINANRDLFRTVTQVLHKVSDEMDTKLEMEHIARIVRSHYTGTQTVPFGDLTGAIKDYYENRHMRWSSELTKDVWGTRYRLSPANNGFFVVSAGPDKRWGTTDDLRYLHSLANLGYRGAAADPYPRKP